MPNIEGSKWGSSTLGTTGGTVTWSIVGAGVDISRFGISTQISIDGSSFFTFDFVDAIAGAFAEWSTYGDIDFVQVADDGLAAGAGVSGDIRIYFGDIPGDVAGLAFYPSSYGLAIGGDLLLDTLDRFNTDQVLFTSVALHEIGHSLGLGHVDSDSIMTPIISETSLQPDDIEGIQEIYGIQDNLPSSDVDPSESTIKTDEKLIGSSQSDTILGAAGDDTIIGLGGSDRLYGDQDNDRLVGRGGLDRLYGNDGDDTLLGGSGSDTMNGGAGNDSLAGGADKDKLLGSTGNDNLSGGAGNDVLKGGAGDDILSGEDDIDRFVFNNSHGHDQITDFVAVNSREKINLRQVDGFDSFKDVADNSSQVGSDVLIQTSGNSSILLINVDLAHLDSGDFLL